MHCARAHSVVAEDKTLFDFEEADSVNSWSNIDLHVLREAEAKAAYDAALKASADPSKVPAYKPLPAAAKEPAVKIEWTTEGAARGQHAMKLTFAGGRMPTISVPAPLDDWRPYKGFAADVTASRTCIVVFRAMVAASKYGTAYVEGCSRWEFAARLSAGKNTVVAPRRQGAEQSPDKVWNNVRTFQIYMLQPKEGEVITIDNIRLLKTTPKTTSAYNEDTQWPKEGFRVAGTELVVKNADDLGEQAQAEGHVAQAGSENRRAIRGRHPAAVRRDREEPSPGGPGDAPPRPEGLRPCPSRPGIHGLAVRLRPHALADGPGHGLFDQCGQGR